MIICFHISFASHCIPLFVEVASLVKVWVSRECHMSEGIFDIGLCYFQSSSTHILQGWKSWYLERPTLKAYPPYSVCVCVVRHTIGKSLPSNVKLGRRSTEKFYPAASLMAYQHVQFNFGNTPYRYPPPDGCRSFNNVMSTVGNASSHFYVKFSNTDFKNPDLTTCNVT